MKIGSFDSRGKKKKTVKPQACWEACLFDLYAERMMQNARLRESQARIEISGWNINNLRYTNETTLMAESEEELISLLMRVKAESEKGDWKSWLETQH